MKYKPLVKGAKPISHADIAFIEDMTRPEPMFYSTHPYTPQYKGGPCAYIVNSYVGQCGCKEPNEVHTTSVWIYDANGNRSSIPEGD